MGTSVSYSPDPLNGGLFEAFAIWLIAHVTRRPWDKRIGTAEDPYMLRWWVIPRNNLFNIYLHNVLRSDDPTAPHDHMWWNISIVLTGYYIELMWTRRGIIQKLRGQGSIVFRWPQALHRLVITDNSMEGPTWTLFITGPSVRNWGFRCPWGWRPWHDYVALNGKTSVVGAGCGETS